MNANRLVSVARWIGAAIGLAAIVAFYRVVFQANQTTVALTMLLLILFVAANWGLRLSVVCSFAAAGCYNYFFVPPIGSLSVADPQNLLAIVVFLMTSVVASRLSHRMRAESQRARSRQAELGILYSLSRGLLQTDELTQMTNSIPTAVMAATGCQSALFFLLQGERLYRAGVDWPSETTGANFPELARAPGVFTTPAGDDVVPLRTGVRPQGVLILRSAHLSTQTLEAIGGLVSVSLDRARALEAVTHEAVVKESERFRSSIIDSITQDLQTPLTSIKEAIETMLTSEVSAQDNRQLLTIAKKESDRLNQVITETVELARFDKQQVSMNLGAEDLKDVVESAVESLAKKLDARDITLRFPTSLPKVLADADLLRKVVEHLIENAAAYSSAADPIFISAAMDRGNIACSIADRGIGISVEEQALIFGRLYTLRNRHATRSSSNMSLAICRAILEAQHGTISVTSQLGRGSVFTFSLPLA